MGVKMKTNKRCLMSVYILLVLVLASVCEKEESRWKGTIEEVKGVTVVKNPSIPLNPEMQIIFEEDLTIGIEEGDENYMFGSIVFVNTDDEGNIYVTDWDRKTVKKYDHEGSYLKSIGRPGQGPGEFQNISEVRFDVEGNIYLNDVANQRISILSKEGDYLRGIKVPSIFERLLINSKGFYIAMYTDVLEEGQGRKWDYVYGLFNDEFNLVEEFLRLHQEVKAPSQRTEDTVAKVMADLLSAMAFEPFVNYVLDTNDLIYFGYPKSYEIKVFSSEGKLIKIIQRGFEPLKINGRHKEYFQQNQGERFLARMSGRTKALKEKIFSLIEYPEYKPTYERFALMENGWIFVVVDSVSEDLKLIDIFNENGEYLARFETDISTEWLSFNNGKAYAIATIDDYKFIKRYSYEILGYEEN